MSQRVWKFGMLSLVGFLCLSLIFTNDAEAAIHEQFKVSRGVDYKDSRFLLNNYNQAVRTLEVNVADPYTNVEVSVPTPLDRLAQTTTQALEMHSPTNRVVGAMNGSFYNMTTDRLPMYLIAKDNRLVHAGIVASTKDQYVNEPLAFGINSSGKGMIDTYDLDLYFTHKGNQYPVTSSNKQRTADSLIVYTPDFPGGSTKTNENGIEVVVGQMDDRPKLKFGQMEKGVVQSIRRHGEKSSSKIPTNGFVLSAHGDSLTLLKDIQIGDEIELATNIDNQWMNADFMLAGGPLLVKDGKVSLSMDPNSSRAKQRAARSAIAVDRTGTKVYFITVDGGQAGYSQGMNLTEFAEHLVSLGVDRALNVDGGGSTTMAVRSVGSETVSLANRPSAGAERRVSTILTATSTAPVGQPTYIHTNAIDRKIARGSSVTIPVSVLDQYYNPLSKSAYDLSLSSDLGTFSGTTLTANKTGKGTISIKAGSVTETIPIEVYEQKGQESIEPFESIANWSAQAARGQAAIQLSATNEPHYEGKHALKLSYDFTTGEAGTSAAYVKAKKPVKVPGHPQHLGMRLFGDAGKQWVRGRVIDANGKAHTINFTEERGLTWMGWSYVKAAIPATIARPIQIEQIYIAQPNEGLKGKGDIYFDQLTAIYTEDHVEPLFKDTGLNYMAETEVTYLIKNGIISGFPDGTFRPNLALNRVQAAILFARALDLDTSSAKDPGFKDVPKSYTYYKEIAAAANAGIIQGKEGGTKYDPYGLLTRAEMAAVLQRAYKLPNTNKNYFSDNLGGFAYDAINSLAENGITIGYEDGTFKGSNSLTRTEFSIFLYRGQEK